MQLSFSQTRDALQQGGFPSMFMRSPKQIDIVVKKNPEGIRVLVLRHVIRVRDPKRPVREVVQEAI